MNLLSLLRSHLSGVIRQISLYTSVQILVQFLNFIGMVLVSRFLGPISFGIYSFVQICSAMLGTVLAATDVKFQMDLSHQNSEERVRTMALYFYNKLLLTFIVCIVGITISYIFLPFDLFILTSISFFPFLFSAISVWTSHAIFEKRIYTLSLAMLTASSIVLLLKGIIIWQKLSIIYLIIATTLDLIILNSILAAIFLSGNRILKNTLREVGISWVRDIRKSFKIFLLNRENILAIIFIVLWQTFILRADQFIISALSDAYTLGVYSIAVRLTEASNVLIGGFTIAVLPRLQQLANSPKSTSRGIAASLVLGLCLSGILYFIAPWIVPLLFGATYVVAIPVLQVYAFTIPFLFSSYYILNFFTHKKMYATIIFMILASGCVGIFSSVYLFYTYGIIGTAYGSIITYTLFTLISIYVKSHGKYGIRI